VDEEHLATSVVNSVGPAGNFLAEEHTVRHFREAIWTPSAVWTRQPYDLWQSDGATSFGDRLRGRVESLLKTHEVKPLEDAMVREIDRVVDHATRE
jgi:trimethylamine--corrinoid protein Co-methyltransferase